MSASVAFFHVGPRSPKQKYAAPVVSFHVGPQRPERREMIDCARLRKEQKWNLTDYVIDSVCVLELLSTTSS